MRIVIEGGGDSSNQEKEFVKGWTNCFRSSDLAGKMPRVIRGRGRSQAIDRFIQECKKVKNSELVILLLDSEEGVTNPINAVEHIINRDLKNDSVKASALRSFVPPNGLFLMIRTIEHWFLRKPEILMQYFKISDEKSQQVTNLEGRDKNWVYDYIRKLTNGKYITDKEKFKAFDLIGKYSLQDFYTHTSVAEDKSQPQLLLEFLRK